mgnify:CR=1 FL=1
MCSSDLQDINHSDKETLSQNESTSEEENSLSEESALTEENKIIEENTLTEENSFTEENQQLEENADIDIPLPQENLRNGEEEVKKQNSSIITYNELENQENEESDVYDEELDSDSTMYSDSTPDDQDGLGFDIF